MVAVGFMPLEVGQMLPSKMNKLGMSCERPQASTTELPGSTPILAVPSRCQPVSRMSGATIVSYAPAAPCSWISSAARGSVRDGDFRLTNGPRDVKLARPFVELVFAQTRQLQVEVERFIDASRAA